MRTGAAPSPAAVSSPEASVPAASPVLPARVRDALWRLDAPAGLDTLNAVLDWARTDLRLMVTCCVPLGATTTRGSIRHRTRVDPGTGETYPDPGSAPEAARVQTSHFLWALRYPSPPTCVLIGPALATWVGATDPPRAPWPSTRVEEMAAARTLMRLVAYADDGLPALEYLRWAVLGATAANVRHLHETTTGPGSGPRRMRGRILTRVQHRLGGPGQPYAGPHEHASASDVDEVIDLVAHEAATR